MKNPWEKRTPGPWRVRPRGPIARQHEVTAFDIRPLPPNNGSTAGYKALAVVEMDKRLGTREEAMANATLMAYAPELLEELQFIRKWMHKDDGKEIAAWIRRVDAIVFNIEGAIVVGA